MSPDLTPLMASSMLSHTFDFLGIAAFVTTARKRTERCDGRLEYRVVVRVLLAAVLSANMATLSGYREGEMGKWLAPTGSASEVFMRFRSLKLTESASG